MSSLELPASTVPFDDSWDVLVAGGGPAGCAAATAAARAGARTLLLESTSTLGGMGTSGLVTTWAPFTDQRGTVLYGGLAERLLRATKAAMPHVPADRLDWVTFQPEQLKRLYDEMVIAAGAQVRFNVTAFRTVTTAGHVRGVLTASKGGVQAFGATVVVDCTGDGDLAAWSGATCQKGDPRTGALQPASLCFLLANVNTEAYRRLDLHPNNPASPVYAIVQCGRYPAIKDPHCCNALLWPGVVTFNAGHVWEVDGTDPASVSRGVMRGRELAEQFRAALAEFCPEAFGQATLVATAPSLGIRETRRIEGDYTLTLADYLARRKFPDDIARNNYWIDIHTAANELGEALKGHGHVTGRFEHYQPGESHGIPYRCLTPRGLRNLLVAGRCLSCDRPVQGSIRVMPACLATGEAAGLAAALAACRGGDVRAVDVAELRARLIAHGAYLPVP